MHVCLCECSYKIYIHSTNNVITDIVVSFSIFTNICIPHLFADSEMYPKSSIAPGLLPS